MKLTADLRAIQWNWKDAMEPARKPVVELDPAEFTMAETENRSTSKEASTQIDDDLPRVHLNKTVYTQYVKTVMDRILALVALLIFFVPMLITGLMVLGSMGSPMLFQQRRVGLNGVAFNILKFRTMGHDRRLKDVFVQHEERVTHKSDNDPRHTRVGKFLRKYSLDELPQLINVIQGEMSIVGPRPELETVVNEKYQANLHQRHMVRPGLTGLWQISARGEGPMHENGEWDLKYVEQISFVTDVKIICKTPFVMFSRSKGA